MSKLVIDYVVPDLPPGDGIHWHTTGMPPLGLSLLKAMTPPELDGYALIARCHHERTMGAYDPAVARPDVLAVSVCTPAATRAYAAMSACRSLTSWQGRRIRTVAGGPHVSALPVEALQYADGIVRGDTPPALLLEVLRWVLRHIEEEHTEQRVFEYLPDLSRDTLPPRPVPDRSWYPHRRYYVNHVVQTSVGCPYDCDFCSVTFTYGNQHRHIDYADLAADIAALPTDGLTLVIDDNFIPAGNIDHVRQVCALLAQRGSRWCCELAPLSLYRHWRELLPLFARTGCTALYLGIESIDGDMAKQIDHPGYHDLISAIHDHGIAVVGLLMFGTQDDETADIFARTAEWARDIRLDFMNLGLNTPMPGARNYERLVRTERIIDWCWAHYDTWYPVFRHRVITPEAMFDGIRNCYRWFYGWSSMQDRLLSRIGLRTWDQSKQSASLLGHALLNLYLGNNPLMRWHQRETFADYREQATSTPNASVLAQFGSEKPVDQFDARHRIRELRGEVPNRTPDIIGHDVPLTVLRDNTEVICASS